MKRNDIIELYNDHAEARGDLRPIGPRSKLTTAQLKKKLVRVEKESESWTDLP